ncbi:MAG: glycosyltransferase family 39 protein [Lentisphaerota bacterium]
MKIYISGWRFPCFIFVLSLLLCSFLGFLNDIPERDVAGRYAAMAEAFAVGDWTYAFHPRIPPLLPCCAGIFAWLTGCSGFVAAKSVSILFFALCVFPLYGIFRRTFGENIAQWGCVLLMFSSHFIRIAVGGLRDSGKGMAMMIACYAIVCVWQQRTKLAGYIWCACGAALLTLTRGDCVLYALLFLSTILFFELYRRRSLFFPWRTVIALFLYLLCLSPQLAYNYRTIGYPVPEVRYGMILNKLEQQLGLNFYNRNAIVKLPGLQSDASPVAAPTAVAALRSNHIATAGNPALDISDEPSAASKSGYAVAEFIDSLFKGFYPYFFFFAIPVIVMRIYRREWKTEESILLAVLLGHAFLIVMQIIIFDKYLYVSRRYLIPVAPLALGWSAIGMLALWEWLRAKVPVLLENRAAAPVVFAGCAIALLADSSGPTIKDYTSHQKSTERNATLQIAEFIRDDFGSRTMRINRELDCSSYRSNRRPLIFGDLKVLGYCAGGQDIEMEDTDVRNGRISPDYIVDCNVNGQSETQYPGFSRIKSIQINNVQYAVWKAGGKLL